MINEGGDLQRALLVEDPRVNSSEREEEVELGECSKEIIEPNTSMENEVQVTIPPSMNSTVGFTDCLCFLPKSFCQVFRSIQVFCCLSSFLCLVHVLIAIVSIPLVFHKVNENREVKALCGKFLYFTEGISLEPLSGAVKESFSPPEHVQFKPYRCTFHIDSETSHYVLSKYINYDTFEKDEYLSESSKHQEDEEVFALRIVLYSTQLAFMRIVNHLEPPISFISQDLLFGNFKSFDTSNDFDKTVNCYNPITKVSNEVYSSIRFSFNESYLESSEIFDREIIILRKSYLQSEQVFQEKMDKSDDNIQFYVYFLSVEIVGTMAVMCPVYITICFRCWILSKRKKKSVEDNNSENRE